MDYNTKIDWIDAFIFNQLDQQGKDEFLIQLQNEEDFNNLYLEHSNLLMGIDRISIKSDILKGRRIFQNTRYLKLGLYVVLFSIVIALSYFFFQDSVDKEKHTLQNSPSPELKLEPLEIDESLSIKKDTFQSKTFNSPPDTLKPNISTIEYKLPESYSDSLSLTKSPQLFTINSTNDTILKGAEGTILSIKANSLFNPTTKKPFNGQIKIELTEYYKISDIIIANLTTTSNGKQLVTGGMINLRAFGNGRSLQMEDGKSMQIVFADRKENDSMQLFYGERKGGFINWNLHETAGSTKNIEEEIEVPFAVVEEAPIFKGCEHLGKSESKKCTTNSISEFIVKNFNPNLASALENSRTQTFRIIFKIGVDGKVYNIQSNAPQPELQQEIFRVLTSMPRMTPGKQRGRSVIVPYSVPLILTFQEDEALVYIGNVSNRTSVNKSAIPMDTIINLVRGPIEDIREIMHDPEFIADSEYIKLFDEYKIKNLIKIYGLNSERKVTLRKELFQDPKSRFDMLQTDSVTRGGHVVRKVWDSLKIPTTTTKMIFVPRKQVFLNDQGMDIDDFENRLTENDNSDEIESYHISQYAFSTTKLGWLNCDKFRMSRRDKFNFYVNASGEAQGSDVNMVYKSVKSIFPGRQSNEKFSFGLIGPDEEVILIAIKKEKGKLFFDSIETKTQRDKDLKLNLQPISLEGLKTEMKKLDALFD